MHTNGPPGISPTDSELLAALGARGLAFPDMEALRLAHARAERHAFLPEERLGVRIIDRRGNPIHGHEDDPFGSSQGVILEGEAEEAARRWVVGHADYRIREVWESTLAEDVVPDLVHEVEPLPQAAWSAEGDGRFSSAP